MCVKIQSSEVRLKCACNPGHIHDVPQDEKVSYSLIRKEEFKLLICLYSALQHTAFTYALHEQEQTCKELYLV